MAKKKNRKKELKRKQKREDNNIIDFASFAEKADYPQAFSEPELDEESVNRLFKEYEQTRNPEILEQLASILKFGDTKMDEADELLYQAMEEEDEEIQLRLLTNLLAEYPDHFEARFQSLILRSTEFSADYLKELQDFYQVALEEWKKADYESWYSLEARSPLKVITFVIENYLQEGLVGLAGQVVDFVRSKIAADDRFPPGFIYLMMGVYNSLYQEEKIEDFYEEQLAQDWQDDGVLVHLIIAKLLNGDIEAARALFVDLAAINNEILYVFDSPYWVHLLDMANEVSVYRPNSALSLQIALHPLQAFLETKNFVIHQMLALAEDYQDSLPDSPRKRLEFFNSPCMKGIQIDKSRYLCDAGILSQEDLEKHTEKEILAISGIGPATVKKLKENGVRFKKS
ncbi:MAG: hypothetical protein MSS16_09415 [Streptococcus orisratti]|uniref:hypothetical protein n=1 Tax=Streptococcus orisratti TaxID=114652 RepID=UPI002354F9CA|nr:hypothetical protein [Streptococcus orisratti]MCI7678269.1 hypothetical protein [Streptococcus orisratti]